MKLLVSNVGSTSLKFKLFEMPAERVLCDARIERVGGDDAIYTYKNCLTGHSERATGCHVPTYTEGIRLFLTDLCSENGAAQSVDEIAAVGFKTVLAKGFYGVHELTDEVLEAMRADAGREAGGRVRDGLPPHDTARAHDVRRALRVV